MAIPVLIIGRSASGKTYSLKGFNECPEEVGVIAIEKPLMPFPKSKLNVVSVPDYEDSPNIQTAAQISLARYSFVERAIKNAKCKALVIDDSQYLMAGEFFDRGKEKGYDKFTDIAMNFRALIHNINKMKEPDKIVYFLHHSEDDGSGREKVKTIGKMLDEKLTVEGCFNIVIYCKDQRFYTQSDGISTAKTPEGMFDSVEIPNDLKVVDARIREYWGLDGGTEK